MQPESPAKSAGIQVGDVLETLDGEPIGDPLSLPQRLLSKLDEEIKLGVRRGGTTHEFTLKVGPPVTYEGPYVGGPIGIDGLGIAYQVLNEIADVLAGSSAEAAGLKPGQSIDEFQFVTSTDEDEQRLKLLDLKPNKPQSIDKQGPNNWASLFMMLQEWPVGTRVKLTVATDGKWVTEEVVTSEAPDFFDPTRNLRLCIACDNAEGEDVAASLSVGPGTHEG